MQINSVTRQSGILATLLLLLILVVSNRRMMLAPYPIEVYGCIVSPSWLRTISTVISLLFVGVVVGRTAVVSRIFKNFCTFPITIFGVIACGIFVSPDMWTSSVAALCVACGELAFVRTMGRANDKNLVFIGSLFFGCAPMFYPPCVIFVILLPFMSLMSFQSWRKIVIATVGWILPFTVVSYVNWYTGGEIYYYVESFTEWFTPFEYTTKPSFRMPIVAIAMVAILIMLVIVGLVLYKNSSTKLVRVDRTLNIVFVVMVLSVTALVIPRCTVAMLPIIAVPTSILAAMALDRIKVNASTLIYYALLLLTLTHLFIA